MLHNASYTYVYFFWILSPINMKFGQILVCCMTNISNLFLVECRRLQTSSRIFYDFIKMTLQQDLIIFHGWHKPFLIVLYSAFPKKETRFHLGIFGYWVIGAGCSIKKDLESSPNPPNCSKDYWELLSTGQVWWLHDLWFKRYIQKCTLSHILILIVTSLIW